MNFKNLIEDNDAVSPVIGVILMVAITVILAAVIGTFVLGLGDQVSNTAPSASFSFDFDNGADQSSGTDVDTFGNDGSGLTFSNNGGLLTITHDGGDKITASQLSIKGSTGSAGQVGGSNSVSSPSYGTDDEITAGSNIEVWADSGDTVRVIWEASGGGDTATLGKWTGPDA